jgi:hypothetical protein
MSGKSGSDRVRWAVQRHQAPDGLGMVDLDSATRRGRGFPPDYPHEHSYRWRGYFSGLIVRTGPLRLAQLRIVPMGRVKS